MGMALWGHPAAQAVQPVQRLRSASLGATLAAPRRRSPCRVDFPARRQIAQRAPPGGGQRRLHPIPVDRRQQRRRAPLADDPVGKPEAAENAHRAGTLRRRQLRRRHRGEEGPVELNGKHRPVEGIGHHIAGISEQTQKLRRAGIQDLPGLGMNLRPDAAQLHHRQPRLRRRLRT